MAVTLISYATPHFYLSQQRLVISAKKFGLDQVISFNNIWLHFYQRPFIKKNKKHFKSKKGAGYWVWKPFIIHESLKRIKEDDYLIYLDSGIEIVEPVEVLLKICNENDGLLLFSTFYFPNKNWTKRDAFVAMECDKIECWEAKQLEAGMMVLKKTPKTSLLISEWLSWCENFNLISDLPNKLGLPNFSSFKAHRHDQSLLSLLAFKFDIEPFRSPHKFTNNMKLNEYRITGEFLDPNPALPEAVVGKYATEQLIPSNSMYGTLFNLHRERNRITVMNLKTILKSFWQDAKQTQKWLKNQSSSA